MNEPAAQPGTAITTKVGLRAGAEVAFAGWQSAFTRAAAEAEGFLAIDIAPAFPGSADWQITQRFRAPEALARWRASARRRELFAELAPLRPSGAAEPEDAATSALDPLSCVTEVIATVVGPGKEADYQAWAESVQASQATFPGYMGMLLQAPISSELRYWTTLVRFSTPAHLDGWLGSAERKALLRGADPTVSTWRSHRLASPFAGWFPASEERPPPAAWKQTTLVLLVLFPVVMLEIEFLSPYLAGQHLAIATFIGNAISVSLVSWPLMKIAVAGMGWWLHPAPARRWQREALGAATMLGLYAIELVTFMLIS
jgi:antibiotic biosynthesis monooxygenase (ABM) superfamily enzyme